MRENQIRVESFIWGVDNDWEGICTTFDIATQGSSLGEVKKLLRDAIEDYLAELNNLPVDQRKKLLNRKSPIHLRLSLHFRFLFCKMRNIVGIAKQIDDYHYNPA